MRNSDKVTPGMASARLIACSCKRAGRHYVGTGGVTLNEGAAVGPFLIVLIKERQFTPFLNMHNSLSESLLPVVSSASLE